MLSELIRELDPPVPVSPGKRYSSSGTPPRVRTFRESVGWALRRGRKVSENREYGTPDSAR
jgi:hypothetical protein